MALGPVWVDLIIGIVVVGGAWYWLPDVEDLAFCHLGVGKRRDLAPICSDMRYGYDYDRYENIEHEAL